MADEETVEAKPQTVAEFMGERGGQTPQWFRDFVAVAFPEQDNAEAESKSGDETEADAYGS